MPPTLTLLIPELLWSEPADPAGFAATTPALTELLGWGSFSRGPALSEEETLAQLLGTPSGGAIDLAEARFAGEVIDAPAGFGGCLCADPVHLHFHQDRLLIADAKVIGPNEAEAQALTAALNTHFAERVHFIAASPDRWYALFPATMDIDLTRAAAPLSTVVGRQLPLSAFGHDASHRKLASEIQMVLHAQPCNEARAAAGDKIINALWLWSGPVSGPGRPPQKVWSDAPLARGLAAAAKHPCRPAPASATTIIGAAGTANFAVLDSLNEPSRYQDSGEFSRRLEALEREWFAPISRALRQKTLSGLTLVSPSAYGNLVWDIPSPTLWQRRPWARTLKPLSRWAADLAQTTP